MLKSSKRFILSTSGLNSQGFRMLTEGAILDDFEKNPVLLWNHQRPEGNDKNQILPLGYWTDIEINGDEISSVPVFDDKDPFALTIYNKVEADILRMCSAGAEPLELSDDEALLLPGQTRATVTKWKLKEGSICDIGANPGSLAVALYDAQENIIKLSETDLEIVIPKITMNKNQKPASQLKTPPGKKPVKLADPATEPEEQLADPDNEEQLSDPETDEDKDALIQKLQEENEALKAQLNEVSEQLVEQAEEQETKKVENLVSLAVSQRRITLAQKPHFINLAKADFKGTVALLNTMKPALTIKNALANSEVSPDVARLEKLSAKSFDELFRDGELEYVKLNAPDTYKAIYKNKFGKEPKN